MHGHVKAVLRKNLFFVVGCQKSGTTWVQNLLDAHPEILCRGELCFGPVLLPTLHQALAHYNQNRRYKGPIDFTDEQLKYLLTTAIGLLLGNLLDQQMVKCVGEKTPEHAMLVPQLATMLPRARFIHIIRDGRDAAVSGWFYNILRNGESFKKRFPDLPAYIELFATEHWVPYIRSAQSIARTAPHRYMQLRYEDLHAQPETLIRQMLEFLDVDASDESVATCRDGGAFEKHASGRQRGQLDAQSFYRKGIVGDWKNHFDQRCVETFTRFGGPLLAELGYEEMGISPIIDRPRQRERPQKLDLSPFLSTA